MKEGTFNKRISATLILIGMSLIFAGCNSERPGVTTSFGTEDILSEGEVLGTLGDEVGIENENAFSDTTGPGSSGSGATATSGSLKTATSLDVDDLPENIAGMVDLCDTLNIASVERGEGYGNSSEYLWDAIHIAVLNSDFSNPGYNVSDSTVDVSTETVKELIRGMFGKIKGIPDIPDEYTQTDGPDVPPTISVNEETGYTFLLGDRGTSMPEVRRATAYSDGSAEIEVALIDSVFSEEIVSFIYSMRMNTKDTSASAKYDYEITGQRPANRTTANKMNGVPYITMVMQNYGSGINGTAADNTVEEVPYFASLAEKQKGVETLNARISYEIMEFAMVEEDEETQWHEICSYPVSNENYVQVVVTYARWPDYGTEGDVRSYNFDVESMSSMDLSGAYELCGSNENSVRKEIMSAYVPDNRGDKIERVNISGFLVKDDGSIDFYAVIYIKPQEGESYNRIAAFNSETKNLRWVFDSEEGVVSKDLESIFAPPLTHGNVK